MINALKALHYRLIGDNSSFSLQARIFHELSLIAMVGLPIAILINLFVQVPLVSMIMLGMEIFMGLLYFNSRYLGNTRFSILTFTLCINIIILVNYFYNSGIKGPTLMLFMLSLIFTLAVAPARRYIFWVVFNACFVIFLLIIEFRFPELVTGSYIDKNSYFTDVGFTYVAVIACIGVIINYILKSYQAEKENALKVSIELKEANDSKTKLLSILSHDLRAPLNSIQGFLELLMEYDLEEHEQKAIKSSLLNETKNTQVMLFNLLSWTKSQMDGGVKVNLTRVNLHESLKLSIQIQQTAAFQKMITIKNDINADIFILADMDMLKLVIRNLVNNAIKFTRAGGEINIRSEQKGNHALLIIQDNGIGIAEHKLKNIFSFDAAGTTSTYGTNNEKGVGLGLLLCKEFTDLQGGNISFSSVENIGTTFYLTFPIHFDEGNELPSSTTPPSLQVH